MEICLTPARQAQQMQRFQAAQKVPGVQWHHGKVSLGSTEDDGTEQEAARPERSRFWLLLLSDPWELPWAPASFLPHRHLGSPLCAVRHKQTFH